MVGDGFEIVEQKPAVSEDPASARKWLPPRWCAACDAGSSFDRCWLCAGPTKPLRSESERRLSSCGSQAVMAWVPEAEPEP